MNKVFLRAILLEDWGKYRETIHIWTKGIQECGLFAFTAIDIFTKEADVLLAPEL